MAIELISVDGRFWRMLPIRWQREPLSGAGATRRGGRWNRAGQPALYLSADHSTAVAEFHQRLPHPGTLVPVNVRSAAIVDLTDPAVRAATGVSDAELRVEWRRIADIDRATPPGWRTADRLVADGADGILVPSALAPGTKLVLWRWSADGSDGAVARMIDPLGELRR